METEKIISLGADICGIIGFIISLFAINGVRKLHKQVTNNSINQNSKGAGNQQTVVTKS